MLDRPTWNKKEKFNRHSKKGQPKERKLFSVNPDLKFISKKRKYRSRNEEFVPKKNKLNLPDRETLCVENVTEGQIILGCVSKVTDYRLSISLPHKVGGTVNISDVSNAYTNLLSKITGGEEIDDTVYQLADLYPVGHLITVFVKSVRKAEGDRSFIDLSVLPKDVNSKIRSSVLRPGFLLQVAVSSVEDNGYVLETGIPGVRAAFMEKVTSKKGETYGIGSTFLSKVTQIKVMDSETQIDGSYPVVIKVTKLSDSTSFSVDENTNIMALLPGTLLEAEIVSICEEYIKVKLANGTEGIVSTDHLQRPVDALNSYKVGQEVKIRLLYITNFTHTVHFSMNESLAKGRINTKMLKLFKIDDIVSEATVLGLSAGYAHLSLRKDYHAYCPYRLLTDSKMEKARESEKFAPGEKVACRILGYSLMDQSVRVGVKESLLNDERLSISKYQPGMVVKAKVIEHTIKGIKFLIGETLDGSAVFSHITESCTKNIKSLYPLGKVVKAKVWRVREYNRQFDINLTLKPSFMKSESVIVSDYKEEFVNVVTEGIITVIKETLIIVRFYNDAEGVLLQRNILENKKQNLFENFRHGEVITVRVTRVDPEQRRMWVSMILEPYVKGQKETKKKNRSTAVQSRSCEIVEVGDTGITVTVNNAKSSYIIPRGHFSDLVEHSKVIEDYLMAGDRIDNCFNFRSSENGVTLLTAKPKLCRFMEGLASSKPKERKLKSGDVAPAVVEQVEHQHLSFRFPKVKDNYLFKVDRKVIDNFTEGEAFLGFDDCDISVGQTILVKTERLEVEEKPVMSVEMSEIQDSPVEIMLHYLHCESWLKELYARSGGELKVLSAVKVGNILTGTVKAFNKQGALLYVKVGGQDSIEVDGVIAFQSGTLKLNHGEGVEVVVAHVNLVKKCLHLVLADSRWKKELDGPEKRQALLKRNKNKKETMKEFEGLNIGQKVRCELVVNVKDFAIGLYGKRFIYICTRRHTNDFNWLYTQFNVGEQEEVIIRYSSNGVVIAEFAVLCKSDESAYIGIDDPLSYLPKLHLRESESASAETLKLFEGVNFRAEVRKRLADVLDIFEVTWWCKKHEKESWQDGNRFENFPQFGNYFYFSRIQQHRRQRKKLKKMGAVANKGSKIIKRSQLSDVKIDRIREYSEKLENDRENHYNGGEKRKFGEGEDVSGGQKVKKKKIERKDKKSKNSKDQQSSSYKEKGIDVENCVNEDGVITMEELEPDEPLDANIEVKPLPLVNPKYSWFEDCESDPKKSEDESSSDSEAEKEKEQKKKKKLSKAERIQKIISEENRLHQSELTRLNRDRTPASSMDYEELLQSSPNSSAIWIQFVSFHLQNAEVEKARSVARRALQTISANEEKERLNVWTVLLRLEVMYGDRDLVEETFEEALATNDQKKIYGAMALVYAEADKVKEADKTYSVMIKKYSQDKDVWMEAIHYSFKKHNFRKANDYLQKSLTTLAKKDHIDVIHKCAQLEFQYGDPEKGRTMYESLVSNFPKRLDIWNVYVDMLIKANNIDGARRVLQRMSLLKMRLPKMRSIFKRLLKFEQEHGTNQSVEEVKLKVEEYVSAALKEES